MRRYYYLISSLPDLELEGHKKTFHYKEILRFIKSNLEEDDRWLLNYFLIPVDIKNIVNFLAEKQGLHLPYPFIIQPGTIELDEIKEIWEKNSDTPLFLKNFFEQNSNEKDQLPISEIEKRLLESFYELALQEDDDFIRSWFNFDLQIRNLVTISNSRKFDQEFKHLLIREMSSENNGLLQSL